MTETTAPDHLSLAAQLPASAYYYLMQSLRRMLPLLLNDTPEDRVRRNDSAMRRVAALCPVNIAEAEVAALHVANAEHAKNCLFDSQHPELSLREVLQCRAQAASMSRQSDSSLRMLLRMQAARQKTEANPEACERAAWAEHCALILMAEALSPPPAPATPPQHLSRPAGEIATQSLAGAGAADDARQPQPAAESTQPESAPVEQPQPAFAATSHAKAASPITAPLPPVLERLADVSDDDLMQAILATSRDSPMAASHPRNE